MPPRTEFQPNWSSPPGATITDILTERGISKGQLRDGLRETEGYVSELLEGRATITMRVAKGLSEFLGGSTEFWMARDAQYRTDAAHKPEDGRAWLKTLPLGEMIRFGWLSETPRPADELATCLNFFGVTTLEEWHRRYDRIVSAAALRTSPSFDSDPSAVAAWLRRGQIEAEAIECEPWNLRRFRESLADVRALTRIEQPARFLPRLIKCCSACGVAVAVVRAPKGCRASGATMFLNSKKAMILLSFRFLTDDQFWFTFFHEAGHLILHGKDELFLEGMEGLSEAQEVEADAFAETTLIPPVNKDELLNLQSEVRTIVRFARKLGVSNGIVVGQLQHFGKVPAKHFNNLKTRYTWSD